MKFLLTVLLTLLSINAYAQSADVVSPAVSQDCSSVTLTDAAGTIMGPYSKAETQNKYNQAIIRRKLLLESIAQQDAQIAASSIALQAFNSCVVPVPPPVLTTNVNWDAVALLASQGVNWTDIKASQAGINWNAVSLINGINWQAINKASINWTNWPIAEAQGVNWSTFVTTD